MRQNGDHKDDGKLKEKEVEKPKEEKPKEEKPKEKEPEKDKEKETEKEPEKEKDKEKEKEHWQSGQWCLAESPEIASSDSAGATTEVGRLR